MPIEIFDFVNARGSRPSGRMRPPEVMPRGWVLLAHCFACGKDSLTVARVSRVLARVGMGVLCFYVAGRGESEGNFADLTFPVDVDDLVTALSAMGDA